LGLRGSHRHGPPSRLAQAGVYGKNRRECFAGIASEDTKEGKHVEELVPCRSDRGPVSRCRVRRLERRTLAEPFDEAKLVPKVSEAARRVRQATDSEPPPVGPRRLQMTRERPSVAGGGGEPHALSRTQEEQVPLPRETPEALAMSYMAFASVFLIASLVVIIVALTNGLDRRR